MQIAIDPNQWLALKRSLSGVEWDVYETAYLLMSAWGRPISEVELRRHLGNVGGKFKAAMARLIDLGRVTFADAVFAIKEALDANRVADKKSAASRRNILKRWETRDTTVIPQYYDGIQPASADNQLNSNETPDTTVSASRASFPNHFPLKESESKLPPKSPQPQTPPAEPEPLTLQPERRTLEEPPVDVLQKKSVELEREFEEVFWPAYPLRKGKGQARPKFVKARAKVSLDEIMAGVRRYVAEKRGVEPRYIKHPATWLNGECWEDAPTMPVLNGSRYRDRGVETYGL